MMDLATHQEATMLDTALGYCRRGWAPIPVAYRDKRPLNPDRSDNGGWQDLRVDLASASRFFNGHAGNIGVLLGQPSDDLVDIDLDCQEAIDLAPYFLPPTDATFGRESKPRSHWLYRSTIEKTQQFKDPSTKSMMLELRSSGAQTVFPGSVHQSGEPIEWFDPGDPGDVRPELLVSAVRRLAAAVLLARHWAGEGGRHDLQLTVIGFLIRAGWAADAVARFVAIVSRVGGGEEDFEKRLSTAKDAAARIAKDKSVRGFPALADALGETTAKTVAHWLEIKPKRQNAPNRGGDSPVLALGSDVEIAGKVLDATKRTLGDVVYADGAFYHWTGSHWATIDEQILRLQVHVFDGELYPIGEDKSGVVKLNKSRIDSILSEMKPKAYEPSFFENPPTGINCRSGFIRFADGHNPRLEAHHPNQRQRHVLAGSWSPGQSARVIEGSLLNRLLNGCFGDDEDADEKVSLLRQVAGIVVLGAGTRLKKPKALILKGETAENGKSQILDLLRSLVPPGASTAISPRHFDDGRYIVKLAGKLLNAPDELGGGAITSEEFKKAITGNEIVARDVYKSSVEFKPIAQHVCATNILPPFKGGMDRGVRRRLMVLTFNRVIPMDERVENIGMRVGEEEADLLLAWAIEGARNVLERGSFLEPSLSAKALDDWVFGADPVLAWLEEPGEVYYGGAAPELLKSRTRDVYAEFLCWAEEEGLDRHKLPALGSFTQRVVGAGKEHVRHTRDATGRYFVGLATKRSRRTQNDALMTRK